MIDKNDYFKNSCHKIPQNHTFYSIQKMSLRYPVALVREENKTDYNIYPNLSIQPFKGRVNFAQECALRVSQKPKLVNECKEQVLHKPIPQLIPQINPLSNVKLNTKQNVYLFVITDDQNSLKFLIPSVLTKTIYMNAHLAVCHKENRLHELVWYNKWQKLNDGEIKYRIITWHCDEFDSLGTLMDHCTAIFDKSVHVLGILGKDDLYINIKTNTMPVYVVGILEPDLPIVCLECPLCKHSGTHS